ncbi:hypothetical protein H9Y04_15105 [Streptomyces sp. TRM66268-LWL]|uniref:ATP synthase subunit E n=1 Tax=Streptomyces polyasparticus TaxID=2767826 RepID=A0ABR7SFY4_9ACTN|nr:hypothetical protein [Streptomyces polyasparticus]MBC9713897.1 hypothetical protein [Streptomyces polyasparticus]
MRNPTPAGTGAALEPVRAQLLRIAKADADALLAAADQDAAATFAAAEAQAAAILDEARRQGEADAETARDAAGVRTRRAARARELAARKDCWEELGRQVVARVQALRSARSYPQLHDRLTAYVREVLGPDVHITEAPGGGVIGEVRGRRLDCGLTAFARRALERTGTEAEGLWSP